MKKNIYTKPCTKVTSVDMESLLASMSSSDKLPGKDPNPSENQFSKNHKPGSSLWDETWDDDDDESNE